MPDPVAISTSDSTTYTVPAVEIAVSSTLAHGGDWTDVPYLRLDKLTRNAAPGIDEAELSYHYGRIIRETDETNGMTTPSLAAGGPQDFSPLVLNGKFVRIKIVDGNGNPDHDITWYGVLEVDARNVLGDPSANGTQPTGQQRLTAYGLLRLLERTYVRSAVIDQGVDDPLTIGRGLTFGLDRAEGSYYMERGNRAATAEIAATDETPAIYLFSDALRDASAWTATQAIDHLLHYHSPQTPADATTGETETAVTFQLTMDPAERSLLDWYNCTAETEGRSVKAVLDDLVDRRKGVGYWVAYDEDAEKVFVRPYVVLGKKLTLPSGTVVPPNPNLRRLNFENAFDVESATVHSLENTRYDRVVAEGAFKTTTCTLDVNDLYAPQLVDDWTAAEEERYTDAASNESDYPTDPAARYVRNAVYRNSDDLAHVFARFRISSDWDQRILWDSIEYFAAPQLDDDGNPLKVYPNNASEGEPLWTRGIVFEKLLALKDRYDYSADKIQTTTYGAGFASIDTDPEYLRPLVFCLLDDSDANKDNWKYQQLDRLAAHAADESETRRWSCHVQVLDQGPAIQITVSGGPQHFLARDEMLTAAGVMDPDHDPAKHHGINLDDLRATLTLRLDSRVSHEVILNASDPDLDLTAPQRTKYIPVPDARLDYVVPYTVVQIKDGKAIRSTSGGFVRDDRSRLKDIARMAAEWYGTTRQTLSITFRQILPLVELGWLITEFGSNHQLTRGDGTKVNTVITSIEHDFSRGQPATTFRTSYFELDLL